MEGAARDEVCSRASVVARLWGCERDIRRVASTASEEALASSLRTTADELARACVELERQSEVRLSQFVVGGLRRLPARREKAFHTVVEECPPEPKMKRYRAIHPNSAFKRRWDVLTSVFSVMCVFAGEADVLARASLRHKGGLWGVLGDLALDGVEAIGPVLASFMHVWFIVDIFLNFVTGYVDRRGVLIMSKRRIALNYLFGCFALDLWCATPRDWQPVLDDTCETSLAYCPPPRRGPLRAARMVWHRARFIVPRTLAFAKRRGRLRQVLISGPTVVGAVARILRALRTSLILRVKWRSAAVLLRRALHTLVPTRPTKPPEILKRANRFRQRVFSHTKMRCVVLALLVAARAQVEELEPVGMAINPRVTKIYQDVTPKLRIEGEGFEGDGTNIHLQFVPPISTKAYSVVVNSPTAMAVLIKGGNRWPLSPGFTETTLYVSSMKNDLNEDPNEEMMRDATPVATILGTPSIMKRDDKLIYMTGTVRLYINGTNFRPKETQFVFDPPLYRDVDYVMEVKSPKVAQLTLKTGRKWRSDGVPGPLKVKRLSTGAGDLRIDAKFGGVTVAEVQADLGAHGVTVETTSDKKLYQSSPVLSILGKGFNATTGAGGNTLRWANSLRGRGVNYTIVEAHANELRLKLTAGSHWRANAANLPGPLTLLAVNAGAGPVPVGATEAKKGRVVATIYADPRLTATPETKIFRTLTHELWVVGDGLTRGETNFDLSAKSTKDGGKTTPLTQFVDYLLVVFNTTHARFWLRDGKAWAPDDDSVLVCTGLDTGAGPVDYVTPDAPVVLATVAADASHSTGASITRTVTSQLLYETPNLKKLTVTGEKLCAGDDNKVVMPQDVRLGFVPEIDQAEVFTVTKITPTHITLDLNKDQRWPVGTLKVKSLACDAKDRGAAEFAGGEGVGVATVYPDPSVEAHEDLKLYAHHSRRLVVRGSGFSVDDTQLTLSPTPPNAYRVVECLEDFIALELVEGEEAAWVAESDLPADGSGVPLKVTKIDTSAGEVAFNKKKAVVVATVFREPEGDICDDSCEWANDGVCDDGTRPFAYDDDFASNRRFRGARFDDDYGGFRYDDDDDDMYYGPYGFDGAHYMGYDDYGYGFMRDFDEDDDAIDRGQSARLAACPVGTDCTDCQPRGGDAWLKEVPDATCDNTCVYARDGYCDDGRDNMPAYCDTGTDCQDCGPVGADNFTKYDDEFWDDDAENWYFEDDYWDDYMRSGFDDFYYYADYADFLKDENATGAGAPPRAPNNKKPSFADDDDKAIGFVKSQPGPFQMDPEVTSGGDSLASLIIAGVFVAVLSLAACGALRFTTAKGKKQGCLPFLSAKAKEETARDLASTWSEMTARRDLKKGTADVPITPDVTFSGSGN
ncbi:hypothetical protein CTAYLR_008534 [Chrysophaeum taylorii]|uniref:Uncharacterized protein n=1 Tax=Chrysophaeum taylorii TaxID=2483200 RepID=A0AAD7U5S6_9STRA|nr:hypothetical protein CTAYLR_008534 [Chrysophaeum taylorii]